MENPTWIQEVYLLIGTALAHAIGGILILGYSMEYYFHLRE